MDSRNGNSYLLEKAIQNLLIARENVKALLVDKEQSPKIQSSLQIIDKALDGSSEEIQSLAAKEWSIPKKHKYDRLNFIISLVPSALGVAIVTLIFFWPSPTSHDSAIQAKARQLDSLASQQVKEFLVMEQYITSTRDTLRRLGENRPIDIATDSIEKDLYEKVIKGLRKQRFYADSLSIIAFQMSK